MRFPFSRFPRALRTGASAALALLLIALAAPPADGQSPEQWQQHVDYEMDITLHADEHRYTGRQELTYTNNSPDTLDTVYYHLYFNAFRPTSMMAMRNRELPDPDGRIVPRIFNLGPDEQGFHRIRSLTQDGTTVDWTVDETVMRVDLAEPIPPGASTTFRMRWRAQVPLQTRRSGRDSRGGGVDFTMTQWYPKMAEYDERGWHADPYVNREFYAPYGSFDVAITAPSQYTLGATGLLQNDDEIGRGYAADGSATWRPEDRSTDRDSLTWHFRAEDVHDFAWAADPDYIHEQVVADGTTHHILYKEDVASSWDRLKDAMPRLTRFFEGKFGDYPYPQMTVAQGGDGGMEYPMLTMVAGYDNPGFERKDGPLSILGTTVHEFAHMWYYAALGTNESDYAWMDEGFTTYATEEGFAFLTGREPDHTGSRVGVVRMQELGLAEPFSTPADWFETNFAYGVTSYTGGQMLVDMLEYVVGDQAHARWLRRYLREREYQHPDPFDVELFAEKESGMQLDWYFWQFTKTTRRLDDAIADLEQERAGDGVRVELTLERKGKIRMPQDVKLTLADGSAQWVNVPLLIMHDHKPVPDDWIVTEPWPWVQPKKTFTFTVPARVTAAEIDPTGATPDVNRLNNTESLPVATRFLRAPEEDWFEYGLGVRPLLGYADLYGFGGGVQARGTYMMGDHRLRAMLNVWPEVLASGGEDPSLPSSTPFFADDPSWVDGLDYELRYRRHLDALGPRAALEVSAAKHLGLLENRVQLQKPLSPVLRDGSQTVGVGLTHQFNPTNRVFRFGDTAFGGNPFLKTHLASATVRYRAAGGGDRISVLGEIGGSLRPSLGPGRSVPSSAARLRLEATRTRSIGPFTGRADAQIGLGSNDLVQHKRFVLGGRSVEARWRDDALRQASAAFANPVGDAHLVGYGPSGPVAYLRAAGARRARLIGSRVVSGRLSLQTTPFGSVNALSPLRVEAFSGLGTAWSGGAFLSDFDADRLVADAGVGASYGLADIPHLDRWTRQSDVLENLRVVARFPVWASDPQIIEPGQDEVAFRWLIGVQL